MQTNALTVIHKFIRAELFALAGRFAAASSKDLDALREAFGAAAEMLHGHAEHEEALFETPLRERNAADAERLVLEHETLHADLDRIRTALHAEDAGERLQQLHLDWNRFLGEYLLHLDDEERRMFVPLNDAIPPIELIAQSVAAQEAGEAKAFLDKLYKVTTPSERETIERARAGLAVN